MPRSNLLVHWTGKDIATDLAIGAAARSAAYVARLIDILTDGFWMTRPTEKALGGHVSTPPPASVSYELQAYMTCFTEERLSATGSHANAYGPVGVAVDRQFVLDRWGSPVHYVRNTPNEGIVRAFATLRNLLGSFKRSSLSGAVEAMAHANYLGTFIKGMSHPDTDDFSFIDENEWRIALGEGPLDRGLILRTNVSRPEYRIPLTPAEVRLLVLPDEETRHLLVRDPTVVRLFFHAGMHPPFLTLRECAQV